MKRTEARTRRWIGLGMPKSDQLWPARTGDMASTRERRSFGGDVVGAGAVENDHGFGLIYRRDQSAHARGDCFAFFADIGDEEDGAARMDLAS